MRLVDKRLDGEAGAFDAVPAGGSSPSSRAHSPTSSGHLATTAAAGAAGEPDGEDVRGRLAKHLYDAVHSDNTRPDWQRTSRDTWYAATLVHGPGAGRRHTGPLRLTSDAYGYGAAQAVVAGGSPQHAKTGAWREFYFKGHVEADGASF
jgi:hypothetical protein